MSQNQLLIKYILTLENQGTRPLQEDYCLCDDEKNIFVVADGFGGHHIGQEVAKLGCESIKKFLFKNARDSESTFPFIMRSYFSLHGNILFNAMIYANKEMLRFNKEKTIHQSGGASLIAGYLDQNLLAIANIGTCTSWLYRDGHKCELVIPRSYATLCNPFLYEDQEMTNVPLMALGMLEDLEPEIFEFRIMPKDWLVFATDGVNRDFFNEIQWIQEKKILELEAIEIIKEKFKKINFKDNASLSVIFLNE